MTDFFALSANQNAAMKKDISAAIVWTNSSTAASSSGA
jgi:hypothetical protein